MRRTAAPALDAFASWLTAFGDAWERLDADGISALFALGATYQPTPFSGLLRGRPAIGRHWAEQFEGASRVRFRAQVLGAGDTYGVGHWRVSYDAGGRERLRDGVLLAALDARGLCTSLRAWWHETESS